MGRVISSGESRVRRGHGPVVMVIVTGAVVIGAIIVALVVSRPRAGCPVASSPLGDIAARPGALRLCQLGAPSLLVGSGRLNGVAWRVVVAPPEPVSAYAAAGLTALPGTGGRVMSCTIDVVYDPRVDPLGEDSLDCGEWERGAILAGSVLSGCPNGTRTMSVCDALLGQRSDHLVVIPADGSEFTVHAVPFHGLYFAAFAVPGTQEPVNVSAYDARGKMVASTP